MPLSRASTGAFETSASTRAGSYRSRTRDGSSKSGASTTTRSARTAHSAARHRPSTRRPHQPQKRRPPDMHISPISTARRLLGFQPGVSKPTQARVGGKVTETSVSPLRSARRAHVGPLQQEIRRLYSIKLKLLFNKIKHFSDRFLPMVSTRQSPPQFPLRPYRQPEDCHSGAAGKSAWRAPVRPECPSTGRGQNTSAAPRKRQNGAGSTR